MGISEEFNTKNITMKLKPLYLVLFLIPLFNCCQKQEVPPQFKVTLTTTKSDTLESVAIILSNLSVFSEESMLPGKEIDLFQEEFSFTHDLREAQTTTILNMPFYEIGLSGINAYFSFHKIDGQPVQFLQVKNGKNPPSSYFPFPPNTTIENGKKYDVNININMNEVLQEGHIFEWGHVSSTIKEF